MMRARSFLVRVAAGGLALAASTVAIGALVERQRFGADRAATVDRVERDVRAYVLSAAARLHRAARGVADQRQQVRAASSADPQAIRRGFDLVDDALSRSGDSALSVTIYSPTGRPLAWGGRPSELPASRLGPQPALFVAPGPLGLRLIDVEPVVEPDGPTQKRIGSVAAERVLSDRPGVGLPVQREYRLDVSIVPVSLRARFESDPDEATGGAFAVTGPGGERLVDAVVSADDISRARALHQRRIRALAIAILGLALGLAAIPLVDLKLSTRSLLRHLIASVSTAALAFCVRILVEPAVAQLTVDLQGPGAASRSVGPISWLVASPAALLTTALALVAAVASLFDVPERLRLALRQSRRPLRLAPSSALPFAALQVGAGLVALAIAGSWQQVVRAAAVRPAFDLLGLTVGRWEWARLASSVGLVLMSVAAFWGIAIAVRSALAPWRLPRRAPGLRLLVAGLWAVPALAATLLPSLAPASADRLDVDLIGAGSFFAALTAGRWITRVRHASRVARVLLLGAAFAVPALVLYPGLARAIDENDRRLVERQFALEVLHQRDELKARVEQSLEQIDTLPYLAALVAAGTDAAPGPTTDVAFTIWSQTDLAAYRVASAIEVYGRDGAMLSRFALNLPEYTRNPQRWTEGTCTWNLFEEVSPFGSEDRRLLHAGRSLCGPDGRPDSAGGTLVVHVMMDYATLSFISSQSLYFELFRRPDAAPPALATSRTVELVAYGWSRLPTYTSAGAAWPIDEALFARIYASRQPFWAEVVRADRTFTVYFQNDRAGVYALGYPTVGTLGHLTNLAELVIVAGGAYLLLLGLFAVLRRAAGGRPSSVRALLGEVRASFYRKLFLAFIAVSMVPVLTLAAVVRTYTARRLRADVEAAAAGTTGIAQRVMNDYGALQAGDAGQAASFDDDILVWISRAIGLDVNIFTGSQVTATSKRDLFASGLLPTRTPAAVYRAIALEGRPSFVGSEQVGGFQYLLAAAPVGTGEQRAILTVPLTSRQREIEREVADLDRQIILAMLLFVLVAASIGYAMAERIADPINRLTRASERIARGDLDERIVFRATDEIGALVAKFNEMAAGLRERESERERAQRLEAWAEMARQVAHEIKNPLTPIQLSAEHLRRVHGDRGRPLTPVLDECVETILSQVRLLRQIASDFSSFASSPTPRPTASDLAALVEEVVGAYRTGAAHRIAFAVNLPPDLPPLSIDRALVGRALANIVENSLHAMPGAGSLTVGGTVEGGTTRGHLSLVISDTGVGMDDEAARRVFEPYFSTKATGTGLGLAIARRNIELNGGTITLESRKGAGTSVTIRLPLPPPAGDAPAGSAS